MKHVWTFICEQSIVDADKNLLSAINCIEEFNIPNDFILKNRKKDGVVDIPLSFQVVSFWKFDESEGTRGGRIKIEWLDNNNESLKQIEQSFNIPEGFKRVRNRINIFGVAIKGEGEYGLKVSLKKDGGNEYELVCVIPVDINFKK
jgi:hypothetical protein